jgi:SAM-dependent methyltransferase
MINPAYTAVRHDVLAVLPDQPYDCALELGCSDGATGSSLRDRVRRLVGLDIDPAAVEIALQRGYDRAEACDFDGQPAFHKALADETFDLVLAPDVLEHLKNPEEVLGSVAARLRPGGVVVVSLPNIQAWWAIWTIFTGRFPRKNKGLWDRTHLRWFTQREAVALFSSCGLRVEKMHKVTRLSERRRGAPLAPILRRFGPFFTSQMVFRLRPEMSGDALHDMEVPRAGLLPPKSSRVQITAGLSPWLDERRGSRHIA